MTADATSTINRPLNAAALARSIYKAEHPERFIRTIPAQSLYLAVKHNGLASSTDILSLASLEQCRLLLDFDCWHKDRFAENNFWEWLSVCENDDEHQLLKKLLSFVDLKIIGLLISRYVDVLVYEEPTDNPPAKGYYTPDKGYTWLAVRIEDQNKHFLLSKFLALIFESNADLFYQLLATPTVATPSMLEEESYQERNKRLAGEGIPDSETAAEINAPLACNIALTAFKQEEKQGGVIDIPAIEPLLYGTFNIQPLGSLLAQVEERSEMESELTYIMNGAIVRWLPDFFDYESVFSMAERVKGAINIGLEILQRESRLSIVEIYKALGLRKLYRVGLNELFALRRLARNMRKEAVDQIHDTSRLAVLDGAAQTFPEIPTFLLEEPPDADVTGATSPTVPTTTQADQESGALPPGRLRAGFQAIMSLSEVEKIRRFLQT